MKGLHIFWTAYKRVTPYLFIILFGFFIAAVQQRDNCRINLEKAELEAKAYKQEAWRYYDQYTNCYTETINKETYGFWYELQEAVEELEKCSGKDYKYLTRLNYHKLK